MTVSQPAPAPTPALPPALPVGIDTPSLVVFVDRVWANTLDLDTNVVDVYIGYLRKKIDHPGEARLIQTIRGAGYALREG